MTDMRTYTEPERRGSTVNFDEAKVTVRIESKAGAAVEVEIEALSGVMELSMEDVALWRDGDRDLARGPLARYATARILTLRTHGNWQVKEVTKA